MKKLFCVILMLALCMPFAIAEEAPAAPAFVDLPFDVQIEDYMAQLAHIYGGDPNVEITQVNTVPPWNGLTKSRLGLSDDFKPEAMDICGYPVSSIDLTELVNEQNFEISRMSHITINFERGAFAAPEAYEVVKQHFSEVFGSGFGSSSDAQWVSTTYTEWYLDGERFIAAELWHSKRTNEDVLKIHYGMKDFQGLHKLLNP